jgi:hypothetical protein
VRLTEVDSRELARPVAELQRVADAVEGAMVAHRQAVGAWGPETDETERMRGMWSALYWLNGQPVGPFADGPATRERLDQESYRAWRVARGLDRSSRYTPQQARGIAELLDWARDASPVLPGLAGGDRGVSAA